MSGQKRDPTNFTDNVFHNIGVLVVQHNVVALARQADQLIKSGDTSAIDRAAIQSEMSVLARSRRGPSRPALDYSVGIKRRRTRGAEHDAMRRTRGPIQWQEADGSSAW